MISIRFLAGTAVGATAMYFFDPARGHSRRARSRDQGRAALRRSRRAAQRRSRYAAGRTAGEEARARGAGQFHPSDDRSIELHLHGVLNRLDVDTHDVTVEVADGLVRVRGQVATEAEINRVVDELRQASGVRDVESLLHLPGQPAPNKQPARSITPA